MARSWRMMAEQEAGYFMTKWIAAAKARAGIRYAVVCPNVTGRTEEKIAQSEQARAGSLATRGANLYPPGVWFACRLSQMFRLFCFVLVFMLSRKPRPFVQLFFDIQAHRQPHVRISSLFPNVSLEMSLFPSGFCTIGVFSLCILLVGSTQWVLSLRMVFFYLVITGCFFNTSLCENSAQSYD